MSDELVFEDWALALRAVRDPAIPIEFGATTRVADMGLLGFALLTAPTIVAAIDRAVRFQALSSTSGTPQVSIEREAVTLRWLRSAPRTLGVRCANETVIAEFVALNREIAPCRPSAIQFAHPAPSDTRAHRVFFDAPITWNAPVDQVTWPASLLDRVPRGADRELSAYFDDTAARRLAELRFEAPIEERVRLEIRRRISEGTPKLRDVALALGESEDSVQRALQRVDTSFRALVDDVRRAVAAELLERRDLSLTEVAFLLGFSEQSAFSRAYRRWFGRAPFHARGSSDLR